MSINWNTTELYIYKGLFIAKDIAGDGYNIYQGHEVLDEGYASLKKAMEAIGNIPFEID